MPAFWTRMSTRPKRARAVSTTALLSAGLLTSMRKGMVSVILARRAAVAFPSASRASAMTSLAPSSANTSAMPAPMPRAAPMTMAVLSFRRLGMGTSQLSNLQNDPMDQKIRLSFQGHDQYHFRLDLDAG